MIEIDKSKFKDDNSRYIVQGLFLEDRYNTDLAVFTLDGEDKTYKGRVYPSLKKLYLFESDPEEYTFANTHLFDWPHWVRMCNNKWVGGHIEQWREELVMSLRSQGISTLIDLAINKDSYQAAKYLADEGFIKKVRGRPSKEEVDGELNKRAALKAEFDEDFKLLNMHEGKVN